MTTPASETRHRGRSGRDGNNDDIQPAPIPDLDWRPEAVNDALDKLYRYAEARAIDAINWYMNQRRAKSSASRFLRIAAIVLGSVGGIFPLADVASEGGVNGERGYVFLAVAAAAVAFDRFFGLSAAWMRYMSTAMWLQRELAEFQLRWATKRAGLRGQAPGDLERDGMLLIIEEFLTVTARRVEQETLEWVSEFRSVLAQLHQSHGDHGAPGRTSETTYPRRLQTDP